MPVWAYLPAILQHPRTPSGCETQLQISYWVMSIYWSLLSKYFTDNANISDEYSLNVIS